MIRNVTCVALSALALVCSPCLVAQPVTTAASINYTEVGSFYDIDLEEEVDYTLGANMTFDFSFLGDTEIEYGPGPDYLSAPARDIPVNQLEAYTMFPVDAAYRAAFGMELPENVVGLRSRDPADGGFEELILTVKPSGLYEVGYRYSYEENGQELVESGLESGEIPLLPLNLSYEEVFDTTITSLYPSQYEGFSDSIIAQTVYNYLGYGTMKTWSGQEENVGVIMMARNELYFDVSEQGEYGEPFEYMDTTLYLMTNENVIPRAVIEGDYDPDGKVFTADYVGLLLPTSENPSATVPTGIPGASIDVFPNPGDGKFSVDLTLERSSSLTVSLFNSTGQLIHAAPGVSVNAGANRIPVSTQTLSAGVYLVKLTLADGSSETRRVMVN